MDQVINAALSFPAVIFTVLMGFMLLFWTTVITGGADPSAFDPDVDVDVDVHVDGAEAHGDVDADGHYHGGIGSSLAGFLNLGSVPLSMVASAGVLFGWVSTMMMQLYVQPMLAQMMPAVAAGTVVLGVSGLASMLAAGFATRPFRGAFKIQTFEAGEKLIDQVCKITSSRVDTEFGEARFEMKGAPLVLSVWCRRPNKLSKGSEAVIVGYDSKTNIYEVGELYTDEDRKAALEAAEDDMKKNRALKQGTDRTMG